VSSVEITQTMAIVRAIFPLLVALTSLGILPLMRHRAFGAEKDAGDRAARAAISLLVLSALGTLLAGASYASTAQIGQTLIDPSEPGRLMAVLGGLVFALIVAIGEGRRAGVMGQLALFGIAGIDSALALPIGLAPIAILLFTGLAIGGVAAGGKDDPARARAVFRDLRTITLLLPAVVIAEILRSTISLSTTDAAYATPTSLGAGAVLALSLAALGASGAFPFHNRLVRIFESLPIVGSLMVGVWIPTAISLIVIGEIATIASGITEPIGGAVVPALVLAGVVTILFGAISALLHDDIGEIIGFLAVGNAGWIALAAAAAVNTPADPSSRLLAVPGALTMSLFGLWLIALRRRYGTTSLLALGGWARKTGAIMVVMIGALIALVALPPGVIIGARLTVLANAGGPLAGLLSVIGQLALIAAALRLFVTGFTEQSSTVKRTQPLRANNPLTVALLVGALAIGAGAAGWFSVEIGGSTPLTPPASSSPLPPDVSPSPEATVAP
jgi:NADH-quinone oxidoreductase subunit M